MNGENGGNTITQLLQSLLDQFALFLPNFLKAIGLLIVGWILAKVLSGLLRKLLKKIKVDQLAERLNDIDLIGNSNFKLVPSVLLSKILYYLILFVFLIASTDALNINAITQMMTNALNYVPVLLSASFVFIIGLFLADSLKKLIYTACNSLGIPAAGLISNLFFYFIFINVLIVTLTQAKINTEFIQDNLSIILGGIVFAFAIGYGLATKDIAANFVASFYNKGKINLGDTIAIDGIEGIVVEIDTTSMTLVSNNNDKVIIPLSKLNNTSLVIKDTQRVDS